MRNHYDLSRRRTHPGQRPTTEAKAEVIGLKGRRFPLWTLVFILSLLLGTGTVVYAIATFSPSPSDTEEDTVKTIADNGRSDNARDGFTDSWNEKDKDTPPIWEDSPDTPPIPSRTDKSSDVQQPDRRHPPGTLNPGTPLSNHKSGNTSSANKTPAQREAEKSRRSPSPTDSSRDSSDDGSLESPVPDPQPIRLSVGYPFWMASQVGKSSLRGEGPEEVYLFGYELQADGTVNSVTQAGKREDLQAIRSLRRSGVQVVPIVTGFDRDLLRDLLASPQKRSRTADRLVQWAVDRNFDGIDILFDPAGESTREHFTLFIEELAEKLHRQNMRLGIHVYPATANTETDWKRWGQVADRLKIIPHPPGGKRLEGKESLEAIDQLLIPMKRRVPKEKLHFILPFRGDLVSSGGNFQKLHPKGDVVHPSRIRTITQHLLKHHPDIGEIRLWLLGRADHPKARAHSDGDQEREREPNLNRTDTT